MLFCNVEKNYISRKFSSDLICVLLLLKMIMYLISIKTHCRYVSTFQLIYEDNFEGACCTWYKFLKKLHASMHFW